MHSSSKSQAGLPAGLPRADAYVFDIDGTLLVTRDLVHWNALHEAMLQTFGVDATIEGIPYHGMTDLSILRAAVTRAGVPEQEFNAALPNALQVVCRQVDANRDKINPQICPGIVRLLDLLEANGEMLGVASGNLQSVGWHKIEAADLRKFFQFGFFSDNCESRAGIFKQAVEHVRRLLGEDARVCFVGDTPSDIRAAQEIGATIVAVASGTFSFDDLNVCAPDLCLPHCGELFAE
jgi:phosphoglycolate phosphatase-like HAD superfamily hydrolase